MAHEVLFCRLNPAISLHWRHWDDEYVVFDETSGQTHQMDALRGFVLNALDVQKISLDLLISDVLSSLSLPADSGRMAIDNILKEFASHGLVELSPT